MLVAWCRLYSPILRQRAASLVAADDLRNSPRPIEGGEFQ